MPIRHELLLALVLCGAALLVGVWTDAMGWAFFAAAVVWITIQSIYFRRVLNWANSPLSAPENAPASWYLLAYNPYRALQRQRERARRYLQRLREILALVELIPDAVVIIDQNSNIEAFNASARKLLRLQASDRGLSLASVVRNLNFSQFLRGEEEQNILEFTSPFDSDRSLEARIFTIDGARAVVLVRDNTELNRLLTMRQSFVANVSHELRTPLTVVSGYLETIADETQPSNLRLSLVSKISPPVARIQSLVGDLLLLTRLESSPADDDFVRLAMPQVIRQAVAEVQGIAHSVEQVTTDLQCEHPILGIEVEIYGVCVNLLTNAIRYSPDGGEIEISWRQLDASTARLMISDTGVGIAPEHLSRITERFYRVDMADARSRGGTGLGLAIVKHALLRHGSELQVESELGRGSRFYCDFKLQTHTAAELSQ